MEFAWQSELGHLIIHNYSFSNARAWLVEAKAQGITQSEVQRYLEELRIGVDEPMEERILEVLDIVCGWCQPRYSVW